MRQRQSGNVGFDGEQHFPDPADGRFDHRRSRVPYPWYVLSLHA
jgi:hypothetical protein